MIKNDNRGYAMSNRSNTANRKPRIRFDKVGISPVEHVPNYCSCFLFIHAIVTTGYDQYRAFICLSKYE